MSYGENKRFKIRRITDNDQSWDNIYAGYVIKIINGYYVGESSDQHRVALRQHAARFTKIGALTIIKIIDGIFIKKGENYIIEDAT